MAEELPPTSGAKRTLHRPYVERFENVQERMVSDVEREHASRLAERLQECSLDDVGHQVHLLEGEAADLIPAMAKRKMADVIVMGTACRMGVGGLFIGNTAEKVLRQVDCSVVDFETGCVCNSGKGGFIESAYAA